MKANTKSVKDILLIVLLGVISFYLVLGNTKVTLTNLLNSDSKGVSFPTEIQDDAQKARVEKTLAQTHVFYKKKIAAHEHKINALNGQIKRLQQYKETATPVRGSQDEIASTKPSSSTIEIEEMQAANQQQLVFELEQHLANEYSDSEWAESIEAKMANVITEELQLEGNELVEAACGTTFCRIEFSHESEPADSMFLLAIASRNDLINSFEDIVTHRISAEDSGDGMAYSVFFIARKGYQLPVSANNLSGYD